MYITTHCKIFMYKFLYLTLKYHNAFADRSPAPRKVLMFWNELIHVLRNPIDSLPTVPHRNLPSFTCFFHFLFVRVLHLILTRKTLTKHLHQSWVNGTIVLNPNALVNVMFLEPARKSLEILFSCLEINLREISDELLIGGSRTAP